MLLLLSDDAPNPRALFASGEQGFWYDPSDFSTLFQDTAGTTPVTAPAQSEGLMLDKRLGLMLGQALVSNGSFSTSDGWALQTEVSISGGSLNFNATATRTATSTGSSCVSGRWYVVEFDMTYTSGIPRFDAGGGTTNISATTGHKYYIRQATGTNDFYFTCSSGGGVFSIDNLSVRELPGNHAIQSTALSRPTVQSGYISFDKTDDHLLVAAGGAGTTGFLLACGVVVPASGTARTIFSDRGTNAGYKLSIDAANKITFSGGTGAAFTTLTSANALTAGQKYAVIAWHDGTNLNLSINNVPETPVACGTVTAGTSSITIGKDNGAASGYWGDRIYSMVYRKNDASTASLRSSLFSYIVGKMGGL